MTTLSAAYPLLLGSLVLGAPPEPAQVRTQLDAAVEAKWKTLKLTPEAPADDATFLRRAWLDLAGRVPPGLKVREFLDDRDPNKRARLVESLLASEEFADYWGRTWAERLTGRRPTLQPTYDGRVLHEYLRNQLAANKSYRQIVTELITSEGLNDGSGPVNFLLRYGATPAEMTGGIGRQFLGVTIHCAQCHDHPFTAWKQSDFWGIAAFFSRMRVLQGQDNNFAVLESRRGELEIPDAKAKPDENGAVPTIKVAPRVPAEKSTPITGNRRQALAAWITSDSNPYFARNTVNQAWAQLFGAPLTGDLDRSLSDIEGRHPAVLNLLAEDFKASGYDIKRLVRIIVLSRPYQLGAGSGSKTDAPLSGAEAERRVLQIRNLARYPTRPLSVDQLYQSITQATGHAGDEAAIEQAANTEGAATPDFAVDYLVERALTVQRSLALLNGEYVHKAAQAGAKASVTLNGRRPGAAHGEWLFLTTLSRRPTPPESAVILEALKDTQGARALEDVLWAIINSAEFTTNH